jgi:hypothetical protein
MRKRLLIVCALMGVLLGARRPFAAAPTAAPGTPDAPAAWTIPEDCDAPCYGRGEPRDYAKAFACYRKNGEWLMTAIMQVNGEGTPVDIPGARASLSRVESKDADFEALDAIIRKRETNPRASGPHVDFCKDVAMTTPSFNSCQADQEAKKTAKSSTQLKKIRAGLAPGIQRAFDSAHAAYEEFVEAEGDRAYQEYIDGTIRDQAAMNQQAIARRNFMATVKVLVSGPAARLAGRRSFEDADRELNAVYRDNVAAYVKYNEEAAVQAETTKDAKMAAEYRTYAGDYRVKARAAQHHWVRYRDAMSNLAAARWPDARNAREQGKALVTEDRIRELRGK